MQAHEERVVEEYNDLVEKLDKLVVFLESEPFMKLEDEDRKLLALQSASMATYIYILEQRIDRFKE